MLHYTTLHSTDIGDLQAFLAARLAWLVACCMVCLHGLRGLHQYITRLGSPRLGTVGYTS